MEIENKKKNIRWERLGRVANIGMLILYLVLVYGVGFTTYVRVRPVQRGFYCTDQRIAYPHVRASSVSTLMLFTWSLLGPIVLIIVVEFCAAHVGKNLRPRFTKARVRFVLQKWVCWSYRLLLGFGLCLTFTNLVKVFAGRLRPDFLSVCRPDWRVTDCSEFVTNITCLQPSRRATDFYARSSFPSGHASLSMYGAVLTMIYLSVRVKWSRVHVILPLVQCLPLLMSIYCGLSRIYDNKHHWEDVLCGDLIGAGLAVVVMRKYVVALITYPRPYLANHLRAPPRRVGELRAEISEENDPDGMERLVTLT